MVLGRALGSQRADRQQNIVRADIVFTSELLGARLRGEVGKSHNNICTLHWFHTHVERVTEWNGEFMVGVYKLRVVGFERVRPGCQLSLPSPFQRDEARYFVVLKEIHVRGEIQYMFERWEYTRG